MRLHDKVFLITGSTTGIGEAIAPPRVLRNAIARARPRRGSRSRAGRRVGEPEPLVRRRHCRSGRARPADRSGDCRLRQRGARSLAAWSTQQLSNTDAATFDKLMAVNRACADPGRRAALEEDPGCVLNIGSVSGYCGEANCWLFDLGGDDAARLG
jgi:hypothetical protein